MIHKQKNSLKSIEEFLDSDDEFPDNFFETAEVPAYLDDDRFEEIEFSWIKHNKLLKNEPNPIKEKPTNVEVESKKIVEQNRLSNRHIVKGTLSKCDILCLKSVEKKIPNDILLWFANFLMFKDMQSHFMTPKSCLVSEPVSVKIERQENNINKPDNVSHRGKFTYRVIISKESN
ncbi:uncharacterized protein LOC123722433 [Papilio machaon]|uniref:uncharacterized protein LOC123722433 n=1 Tax=Papilio machaon TaxID=76193 RepID=UPI001E66408E|nr:uncharacterized protein LOC123722433 [Papilio machaon]